MACGKTIAPHFQYPQAQARLVKLVSYFNPVHVCTVHANNSTHKLLDTAGTAQGGTGCTATPLA